MIQLQALLDPGFPIISLNYLPSSPISQYCLLLPFFKKRASFSPIADRLSPVPGKIHIYLLSANASEGESQRSPLPPSQSQGGP